MKSSHGVEVQQRSQNPSVHAAGFFGNLSAGALKDFDAIKMPSAYPKGALLFMEKQTARGVFLLCEGEVKLSISSSEGKTLSMRVVRPGEILGLVAGMAGDAYEHTAEAIHPCQVAFIRREDFNRFVAKHPDASQSVARQISMQYQSACDQLHTLGLSTTAHEKLARLLLTWFAQAEQTSDGARMTMPLTHQELAEFIGTTRETVTRTLTDFKVRHLVTIHGSMMMIPSRQALETYANA